MVGENDMIVTLILGALAGWGAGFAEDHVRKFMAQALSIEDTSLQPIEVRSVALVVSLLLAAIVAWLIASPHAVGALIGALGPRLRDRFMAAKTPDYDS